MAEETAGAATPAGAAVDAAVGPPAEPEGPLPDGGAADGDEGDRKDSDGEDSDS